MKTAEANVGLSSLLESAGFEPPDVRRYMELSARSGTEAAVSGYHERKVGKK